MNTLANIQELARALRNMIRTGIIVETDLNAGRCRVQTGGMCTDWLQWLTHRAGRSRTWWAPSVGEQVLILAVGGELDTAFVLPGIYSGDNPSPSVSADALHIRFPDGAVIEYEPETSALTVSELVLRAGNGNPKGLTGALWRRTSVGFTNFAWVNTSGDTYDVYVEIGNYATGVNIQWDYTSNASVTIHTSPTYTANKPTGLTDGTVYVIYSSHIKPTAADVGALSLSGGQLNGALGIGTSSALGGNSIVLGDNDTGFKQNGDGNLDVYANNVHVMRFVSGSIQSNKTINITGRVNPSDYGNFDSRYVRDIRLGGAATYKPANNGMTWTHQAPSGCVYSGIIVQDTGSNSADNIGGVYYRPVQKYINGTWYNVAQV
ncbi:TPA: phage baseplate assembly protein V [Escherichia coli]|nr:phage baseplate assembly protein V [Escherichia coli]